jgi:potassium efflux system protein
MKTGAIACEIFAAGRISIRQRHEAAVFPGERKAGGQMQKLHPQSKGEPGLNLLRAIARTFAFAALLLCLGLPARAQTFIAINTANLDATADTLQQVETALQQPGLSSDVLRKLQDQLAPLGPTLQRVLDHLTPHLAAQKAQLDQLGPVPDAKAPPESKQVATDRAKRQKAFDDVDALVKRTNLLIVQVDQAQATITDRLRARLTEAMLQREPSIASPALWADVIKEVPRNLHALRRQTGLWVSDSAAKLAGWRALLFCGLLVLIASLYWPVTQFTQQTFFRKHVDDDPTPLHKILAAWRVLFVIAAIPIGTALLVGFLARSFGLIDEQNPLLRPLFFAVVRISVGAGLAQALLAPRREQWRLIPVDSDAAIHVLRTVLIVTVLVSCGRIFNAVGTTIEASWSSDMFARGLFSLLAAVAIAASLWIGQSGEAEESEEIFGPRVDQTANWFSILRTVLWLATLVVLAAVLTGYMSLGRFVIDQIIWVGGLGGISFLLVTLIDQLVGQGITGTTPFGRHMMLSTGLSRDAFAQFAILASGIARVVIFLVAVLAALIPWGVQSADVTSYFYAAFFGFRIGNVTISLSRIVFTLVIFVAGYAATSTVERWLEASFLPHTRLDLGLRNAIKTSIGYIGRVLALGFALAYLGVDFAKLAIVAGALSVGIGFGLQSIVNNFVSGLILLWERAIRVGDWISVGPNEGFVRRINVRSTEIETFDRAAVVIPNSDLVAGVVKNFVRTDKTGRLKLNIPVNAAVDPQKAREVLLDVAKGNKSVLKKPAPFVVFAEITGGIFNFELYCYVSDVTSMKSITSELNFEIYRRFKDASLFDAPAPVMNINLPELEKRGFILREQVDRSSANGNGTSADED